MTVNQIQIPVTKPQLVVGFQPQVEVVDHNVVGRAFFSFSELLDR